MLLTNSERAHMQHLFRVVKFAYKSMIVGGIVGFIFAVIYLSNIPKQYQAILYIKMASSNSDNLETVPELILRLSSDAAFSDNVRSVCGTSKYDLSSTQSITKHISLLALRDSASTVELKVNHYSPNLAQNCALQIFEFIKNSQNDKFEFLTQKIRHKNNHVLDKLKKRISEDKMLLRIDPTNNSNYPAYVAILNDMRAAEDRIEELLAESSVENFSPSSMSSSVYVSDRPVYPNKFVSILIGIFWGAFLGFGISWCRLLLKFKNKIVNSDC